jgi:protein-S-isoprenylcysteine O-methyltransferase Ste14
MTEGNVQHDSSGIRYPPPVYYLIGLAVGFGIHWLYPIRLGRPEHHLIIYTFGIIWILLGALLIGWALFTFRQSGTSPNPTRSTTALALQGPYMLSRNPMYLGIAFLCVGISILANMLWPLLSVPLAMAVIDRIVVPKEERYLEAKFGDEYRQYKARVRRWV